MNIKEYIKEIAKDSRAHAFPILSFPAIQKMSGTVTDLVSNSKLQSEAMAITAREIPSSAAVSLMDLSVEAEAFGASVHFSDNDIPNVYGQLVSTSEQADSLRIPEIGDGRTGVCIEGVRMAKRLISDRPVFAGIIGPYSLAGRLMDITEIMYMCYDEPEMVHKILAKAASFLTDYAASFREAGADGIILAEPLAGILSPAMSKEFSCDYVSRLIRNVQTDEFAVIYHNCGNSADKMLPEIYATGATAYHFGDAVSMQEILSSVPEDMICMGNISPSKEFTNGTPDSIYTATISLLKECNDKPNFILSSGCDIPPQAKWDNINAFFDAVSAYNRTL